MIVASLMLGKEMSFSGIELLKVECEALNRSCVHATLRGERPCNAIARANNPLLFSLHVVFSFNGAKKGNQK